MRDGFYPSLISPSSLMPSLPTSLCHLDRHHIVVRDMSTLPMLETQRLDGFTQSYLVADGIGERRIALLHHNYHLVAIHWRKQATNISPRSFCSIKS